MQYRKKPIIVNAWKIGNYDTRPDWLPMPHPGIWWGPSYIRIMTLEGEMMGLEGDWLIQGVEGEFYPCKDSVFQATYEVVEEV